MSRLVVVRAGWGTLQLLFPQMVARCLGIRDADRPTVQVARVLGARQIIQALASSRPTYPVLALGVEVDLLHAASMAGAALMFPSRRRAAITDAALACTFAVAGAVAAGNTQPIQAAPRSWVAITELRNRSAERLSRRLVPGYREPRI